MIEPIAILAGHVEDRVWHAAWSQNGCFLASCGEDKIIRIWTFCEGNEIIVNCISTLEDAQCRTLRSCEWSPDDRMIASASFDGTVVIWETRDTSMRKWEQIASLEGHDNEVKSVSWSANGNWLATCGRDKKIWIWERLRGEFECVSVLEGHTQDVKFVQWHPIDETILFSCSYDDKIKIWKEDNDDWYCHADLSEHTSTVWALSISEDGSKVVSCSDDCSVVLWEGTSSGGSKSVDTFRKAGILKAVHEYPIYSIHLSSIHGYIATGGGDNNISICRLGDGIQCDLLNVESQVKNAHAADVNCVRWNPRPEYGHILVSTGDDGLIRLWKLKL